MCVRKRTLAGPTRLSNGLRKLRGKRYDDSHSLSRVWLATSGAKEVKTQVRHGQRLSKELPYRTKIEMKLTLSLRNETLKSRGLQGTQRIVVLRGLRDTIVAVLAGRCVVTGGPRSHRCQGRRWD